MIRNLSLALILVLVPAAFVFGAADGSWLKKVPARDHEKANPFQGQLDAIAAGRFLLIAVRSVMGKRPKERRSAHR